MRYLRCLLGVALGLAPMVLGQALGGLFQLAGYVAGTLLFVAVNERNC